MSTFQEPHNRTQLEAAIREDNIGMLRQYHELQCPFFQSNDLCLAARYGSFETYKFIFINRNEWKNHALSNIRRALKNTKSSNIILFTKSKL